MIVLFGSITSEYLTKCKKCKIKYTNMIYFINMFSKNMNHYLIALGIIALATYFGNQIKERIDTKEKDEYEMVKKYLLNDSPLYGFNKPKIWIHSTYEVNARKWRDFSSRNTNDLNEPFIHLTIKSIINHCWNDFHICLIDDETFSKLLPSLDIDLTTIAEPFRSQYRQLGLAEIIYYYGGMTVPNSFLCMKNLKPMYDEGMIYGNPFVCENINRSTNLIAKSKGGKMWGLFTPDISFMGAKKNDPTILEIVKALKTRSQNPHFTEEYEFLGDTAQLCISLISQQKMNLIGGELIGIKSQKRKPILLEDIMEEKFLELDPECYGIYIPNNEILKRPKYQWFAVMETEELLRSNMAITQYMKSSIIDTVDEYSKTNEMKSITAI